jgi:hypothetical protein
MVKKIMKFQVLVFLAPVLTAVFSLIAPVGAFASEVQPSDFGGDYIVADGGIDRIVISENTGKLYTDCDSGKYVENLNCTYRHVWSLVWSSDLGGFCIDELPYCKEGLVFKNNQVSVLSDVINPMPGQGTQDALKLRRISSSNRE